MKSPLCKIVTFSNETGLAKIDTMKCIFKFKLNEIYGIELIVILLIVHDLFKSMLVITS